MPSYPIVVRTVHGVEEIWVPPMDQAHHNAEQSSRGESDRGGRAIRRDALETPNSRATSFHSTR